MPPFRPRRPWRGPNLQTLRNALVPPRLDARRFPVQRLELPLADGSGDVLVGALQRPGGHERSLAVLLHGLSGSQDSAYMIASARALLERGHPVLRLNLRGAGPSRALCRLQYHAGRTADLRDALAALDPKLMERGLLLIGYSLGANMLLKFLAEFADGFPIAAACAVSAPIDLAAACYRILEPRNRFYHWNLLRSMKREALEEGGHLTDGERRAVASARSILEFDERFVAPRNGYPGAAAYYADNMARRFLARVDVPTLVIHACDDPWIPADAYASFPWSDHPNLVPLLPAEGGHVGFHGEGSAVPWHDRCLAVFFDAIAGTSGP
jgi:predicted alpha/beta-fold hydrolase